VGRLTDNRIFERTENGFRDLSVLLLLDLSRSTADKDRHGRSILSVERDAASIMAEAFEAAGDTLAVHGFNSNGREKVSYRRLKEFKEPFDSTIRARLGALYSEHSTRLGAAIRQVDEGLAARRVCKIDKRGQFVEITEAGRELQKKMWNAYSATIEKRAGSKLSDAQRGAIARRKRRRARPMILFSPLASSDRLVRGYSRHRARSVETPHMRSA
jgi:hypothetical protein